MKTRARLAAALRTLTAASALCCGGMRAADLPGKAVPPSCSPALDQAAEALTARQLDAARAGFEGVLRDTNAPAFVRALASIGLARTAQAAGNSTQALAAWRHLAADSGPGFYRDFAARQILETERAQRGEPIRTAEEFREKLPSLPAAAKTFHVGPRGSDAADGSEARPFASLERARDAVRALKQSAGGQLPTGGVRVILEPGDYAVRRPLQLSAEDSGTTEAPVVYQARPGAAVRLRGGGRITGWGRVSDPAVRARLSPAAADAVRVADLAPLGQQDWGDATALRQRPELFANGLPQVLARWPDEGFVTTGEILGTNTFKFWNSIDGCKDGRFKFLEDRPLGWTAEPDVRLYGYWFWDWYEEYQKVAGIDAATRSFTLAEPWSVYGYRKGQRYYACNVLAELDRPGEWYLDRAAQRLYWLPPEGVDPASAEVVLSLLAAPFLELRDVRHVILLGLTFEEARGDGVHISGGADCLVAGCTLRRLGGDGVVVDGGRHHGVFGCRLETLGCGGVRLAGGDRKTLEPGRHFVENCTVADISRLKRTYTPAVHVDGCGSRIAHNRFERMPSSALRLEGNDHLVELNLVRSVVQESDDQGGVDMFGNPLYRGVVLRWNHWRDIGGGTHNGAAGVRLDDMISGVVVHGNVFERCGAVIFGGVQIHGGKDNLVDGNLFLDCFAGVSFSRWGERRWLEGISRFVPEAESAAYAARYPQLATLKQGADVNDLSRNLFVRCDRTYLRDGGVPRSALNGVTADGFAPELAAVSDAARLPAGLQRLLFDPIPLAEIGPYPHPWRVAD